MTSSEEKQKLIKKYEEATGRTAWSIDDNNNINCEDCKNCSNCWDCWFCRSCENCKGTYTCPSL